MLGIILEVLTIRNILGSMILHSRKSTTFSMQGRRSLIMITGMAADTEEPTANHITIWSCTRSNRAITATLLLCNSYLPVSCITGFSAQGQCSKGRGRDNARAEGECIIYPRLLLHCPSALTNSPIMQKKPNYLVLLTYPKQPLVFVKNVDKCLLKCAFMV